MNCQACSNPIDASDVFCRSCGSRQGPAVSSAPQIPTGERRHLTALFYDLVGSTALSTVVDAEDLQIAVREYQDRCLEIMRNFGGTPANTMGDGGLVYFGFPIANEDDPFRAISAGLAVIDDLPALNARIRSQIPAFPTDLQVRIGIHTGTVVVGEVGSDLGERRLTTGEAVNQAARVESAAPTNGVAISATTASLVRGIVETQSLGDHELKGFAEPVELFHVTGIQRGQSRFTMSRHALSPLVGRESVGEELGQRWRDAVSGRGSTVVIRGEAGIGKSRTHYTLRQSLADTRHAWLEIQGSSVMSSSAFHPVIESTRQMLGLGDGRDALAELTTTLEALGIDDSGRIDLIARFLEILPPSDDALSADERRRRTIDAVCDWWIAIGRQIPTVFIAEDMHWYDPSTVGLLTQFSHRIENEPLLLIGTTRPQFELPWGDEVGVIDLEPLSLGEVNELVQRIASGHNIPELRRAQIAARSDGVPLFAEELIHAALDDDFSGDDVPDALRDLLAARLDRLGEVRSTVQLAALLGREFSHELLHAVSDDVDRLDGHLDELVEQRYLTRRGITGRSSYIFRHALLQDTAAESMLRRQRQATHRAIARVLVDRFAGTPDGPPEVVGHHFEQGGDTVNAVHHYRIAAEEGWATGASQEATAIYQRCIELVRGLPETPDRLRLEIDFELDFGAALGRMSAFSRPETGDAYKSAVEQIDALGGRHDRGTEAFYGLAQHHVSGTRFDEAQRWGGELLRRVRADGDRLGEHLAHRALCQAHFWPGNFGQAWEHARSSIELLDPDAPAEQYHVAGLDSGVVTMSHGAWALWALGRPDESTELADRCHAHAESIGDVYQLTYAQSYLGIVGVMLTDADRVFGWVTKSKAAAEEQGYGPLEGLSRFSLGWAMHACGDESGFEMAQSGISILAGLGTGLGAAGCMAVIAEMKAKSGFYEEAIGIAAFGEALADQSNQHYYSVEIHRSAALAHLGQAVEASDADVRMSELAACYASCDRALEFARRQGSPSLELRAVQARAEALRFEGHQDRAGVELRAVAEQFPAHVRGIEIDRVRAELAGEVPFRTILKVLES